MNKLKSLAEHNTNRLADMSNSNMPIKNSIACPQCGLELWDSNPMMSLASMPPQRNIHCDCGYRGYRYL